MKKIISTLALLSLSFSAFSITQTIECKSLDGLYTANAVVNVSTFEADIQSDTAQTGLISMFNKDGSVVLKKDIPLELFGMFTEDEVTFTSAGEDGLESYIVSIAFPLINYGKSGSFKASIAYSLMQDREDLERFPEIAADCKATVSK